MTIDTASLFTGIGSGSGLFILAFIVKMFLEARGQKAQLEQVQKREPMLDAAAANVVLRDSVETLGEILERKDARIDTLEKKLAERDELINSLLARVRQGEERARQAEADFASIAKELEAFKKAAT